MRGYWERLDSELSYLFKFDLLGRPVVRHG